MRETSKKTSQVGNFAFFGDRKIFSYVKSSQIWVVLRRGQHYVSVGVGGPSKKILTQIESILYGRKYLLTGESENPDDYQKSSLTPFHERGRERALITNRLQFG